MNQSEDGMNPEYRKPPVSKLFEKPIPVEGQRWLNYLAHRFSTEHVPLLIRLATDDELLNAPYENQDGWAPLHACRVLAQLRAVEAVDPMIRLLARADGSRFKWAFQDLPEAFSWIGPAAIPALSTFVDTRSEPLRSRILAAYSLQLIAFRHPEAEGDCIGCLVHHLESFRRNEKMLNAFLINILADLRATGSANLLKRAFDADCVDTGFAYKWEDIEIEFGLVEKPVPTSISEIMASMPVGFGTWTPPPEGMPGVPRKEQRKIKRERARLERKRGKSRVLFPRADAIYQLKIVLLGSKPPIWRQVLVPGAMKFDQLSDVILDTMGWEGWDHLHSFTVVQDKDARMRDQPIVAYEDEPRAYLCDAAPEVGCLLIYEYDFGDSWTHQISAEKIQASDERFPGHPVCLDGARACPPEDCGGISSYEHALIAFRDPGHEHHEDAVELLGEEFNPDAFDANKVNRRFKKLAKTEDPQPGRRV